MSESTIVKIAGTAVPVRGNDIDTDRIIPARYLKEITFSRMGEYPFFDERFNADGSKKDHPFNLPQHQGASILVSNANFGCGSSREHAPQSLHRWGIKAIVAESFAEIFAGNCAMLGMPAVTAGKEEIAKLLSTAEKQPDRKWNLDLATMVLQAGYLSVKVSLPEGRRQALMNGTWDPTALLLANASKARETASQLPYLNSFTVQ